MTINRHELDNDAPTWARTFFSDEKNIFVPAILSERSEQEIFLMASFDGVGIIHDADHLYVPIEWLMREFPDSTALAKAALHLTGLVA